MIAQQGAALMSNRPDDTESPTPSPASAAAPAATTLVPESATPPPPRAADPAATTLLPSQPAGADPAATPLPSLPGYEVLGELGRGGMGVVYKARQLGFDRLVAVKMILAGAYAGPDERERFRIEIQAVARLQHPNIVQVHEVGEHDGRPFFSMEFCTGGALDRKLNATPLTPKGAAALVESLAGAVQAAHDKGVIHRDLKPANVLLTEDGAPKVTDFGLAKKLDEEGLTATGAVMGTPSYMAPEQAGGKSGEIGPRTDVYALGAILYECLIGRAPFKGPTAMDTMTQVLSADVAPPRQLQPRTPRDLETICLKCLEKEPARRYGTAAELADDLGRWRRGEAVRARPPSPGYLLGKWARRRRTPLAVAAGMLLLLAAVVTTAFVLLLGAWDKAQKNYETADKNGKALKQTLDSLKRQLSVSARIAAGRSDDEHAAGNVRDSLNWMLRAYEAAPPDDPLRPRFVRLIGARGRGLSDRKLPHDGVVHMASFSPDGRTVVTVSDNTARLWDAESGKELQRLTHDAEVEPVSFSPDGRTVVTTSKDKTARLWDVASGKELQRLTHEDEVGWASFSPDGRTVVTASDDHTARLWDAATGKELQRLAHDGAVYAASFSPNGRMVLTASDDKTARLWDAADGKELQRLTHDGEVVAAAFSPDGRTVLTSGEDKTARLWDAASGKELQRLMHDGPVGWASFSPDGRTVVTGSADKTARLWDAQSGKELQKLTHDGEVHGAWFSPDGRTVVTVSAADKTARLWDAADGKELRRLAHDGEVEWASFSPDGRSIVTTSDDKTARLWDVGAVSMPDDVDPDRLRAWVLVRTGQDFTDEGTLRPLSKEEWEQQRRTLEAKGGDWQPPPDPRQWHLVEAADAEADKAWFAARFHLDCLLKDDPNNADLLRRRDEAAAHLNADGVAPPRVPAP